MQPNRPSSRPLTTALVAVVAVIALALPSAAFAQQLTPPDVQYQPPFEVTVHGTPTNGSSPPVTNGPGTLPFTGLDLAAFAALGVGLLGAGLVIRRSTKPGQRP